MMTQTMTAESMTVQMAMKNMCDSNVDYPKAFHFPQGLAGFSDAKEYGFIYEGKGDIMCLQSIDQPEAAFLITPWNEKRLGEAPLLAADLCACLQVESQQDVMWMLVLNPFADKQWVTANLKAPIALNPQSRVGVQCIRKESDLEIRYLWMQQPGT